MSEGRGREDVSEGGRDGGKEGVWGMVGVEGALALTILERSRWVRVSCLVWWFVSAVVCVVKSVC